MSIDENTVKKVADLARIALHEDEIPHLTVEMDKVLGFMDKLNELNTDGVEPLVYLVNHSNIAQQDVVESALNVEQVLLNAPEKSENYFLIPKVLDRSAE